MDKSNIEALVMLYASESVKVEQDGVVYECAPARTPKECKYILLVVDLDGGMSVHSEEKSGVRMFTSLPSARRAASKLNREYAPCFFPVEMLSATMASEYNSGVPIFTDTPVYPDSQIAKIG